MNNKNAIELKGVTKSYKDFTLGNINLSLPSGSIAGLVGENGAGKSTIIKIILGALQADSGEITVLGHNVKKKGFDCVKKDIGAVLDESYFPEMITARQVGSILKATYENFDEKKYNDYLKRFMIPENKLFREYSRGMKMKLGIASALSHYPKLLLLDEATSGLDPLIRDELLEAFSDFTEDENNTVLISSHIVSDLEKICDYIIFLHKGKIVFFEEKDKLLDEYAIIKLTSENFEAVDPESVIGKRENKYYTEALIRKDGIPKNFKCEHTTLEDIILFFAKGEELK